MNNPIRIILVGSSCFFLWWLVVLFTDVPHFILPGPDRVILVLIKKFQLILPHALITGAEIIAGLGLGSIIGFILACTLQQFKTIHNYAMPILIVSQALPVFALAPILMLWLGYGFASKLAMTTLIVFFPVTASTLAGFRNFPESWELTFKAMRPIKRRLFWHIEFPRSIPYTLAGIRIAASVAPIGAIVGEWVGSSTGLGYLMLYANGRGQTDLMFAALLILAFEALLVWGCVNRLTQKVSRYIPH